MPEQSMVCLRNMWFIQKVYGFTDEPHAQYLFKKLDEYCQKHAEYKTEILLQYDPLSIEVSVKYASYFAIHNKPFIDGINSIINKYIGGDDNGL